MLKRSKGRSISLPLAGIVLEPRLQLRLHEEVGHVDALVDAIKGGAKLPRLKVRVVKTGEGADPLPYLTDGFHTYRAYAKLGKKTVPCEVKHGTFSDAVLDAAAANQEHLGLRRTVDDKRKAVLAILALPEARSWTNPRIAGHVGVSKEFVRLTRTASEPADEEPEEETPAKRTGTDGKQYPARGKPAAKRAEKAEPIRKEEFDFDAMESHLAGLIRSTDRLKNREVPGLNPHDITAAHRILNEFAELFNSWKRTAAKK